MLHARLSREEAAAEAAEVAHNLETIEGNLNAFID